MRRLLPLGFLFLLAACREEPIEVRREAKESFPASEAPAPPRGLRWTAPAGWKELAGSGMRAAAFEPPAGPGKVEVTVVALPGDVGGELANVNRWRGQIGLPPLDGSGLLQARRTTRSPAGTVAVYDFTNEETSPRRLIAGMIEVEGTTWFFKLMGAEKAAAAHKPLFIKLLEGLHR